MSERITPVFSDLDIFAKTLWGEARGEGHLGIEAVASVIMNRVKNPGWWGKTIRTVCLKPYQFSCWLTSDPNRPKLLEVTEQDEQYRQCKLIADLAIQGLVDDPTYGADSYHSIHIEPPAWAKTAKKTTVIKNHVFYITKEVNHG